MSSTLRIVDYSEKSIAVFGDTKPFKNYLLDIGGKYNDKLTFEDKKTPGWIFSKSKRAKVEELVDEVNDGTLKPEVVEDKVSYSRMPEVSRKDFMALVSRVEHLEQLLKLNQQAGRGNGKNEIVFQSEEEDDENEGDDQPRLMHK